MELRSISAASTSYESAAKLPSEAPAVAAVAASTALSSTDLMHKEKYELSISDQMIRKSLEKANKAMEGFDRKFEYSVHEKTGDVMIKVINADTNEVVREIPNEKFLDLMDKLQELAGINIDEKR